jgi:hypothetical protein
MKNDLGYNLNLVNRCDRLNGFDNAYYQLTKNIFLINKSRTNMTIIQQLDTIHCLIIDEDDKDFIRKRR